MPNINSSLNKLQLIWAKYQKSKYYDSRSTVNSHYKFSQKYLQVIQQSGFIEELNGTYLLLTRSWTEKDTTQVNLIDFVFDPEAYNSGSIKTLFNRAIAKLALLSPHACLGINVDSRLEVYLHDLLQLGFKEVIRLSELELLLNGCYNLKSDFAYTIRLPRAAELKDVYEMIFQTYIMGTVGELTPSPEDYQDFLQHEITDLDLSTFVWDQDKIVAQITAVRHGDYAEIKELGVLPSYWRQGIATHIAKLTLNKVYAAGIKLVRFHTDSYNRYGALDLYRKLGCKVLYENIRLRYKHEG